MDVINKRNGFSDEFEKIRRIGSGSFGTVYEVKNKNDNEVYAIKEVLLNDKNNKVIARELDLMSKLKSDSIVVYKDFWIENNYYLRDDYDDFNQPEDSVYHKSNIYLLHIQMEKCLTTLREIIIYLNKKEINDESEDYYFIKCEIFKEILESVDYLHENRVIHRDIKPENILLTDGKNGRFVKICDFGIAIIHESTLQLHTEDRGTMKYMAPEVIYGERKYNMRADIYSLGVVIEELYEKEFEKYSDSQSDSMIGNKVKALTEIKNKMLNENKDCRPSCIDILNQKNLWALELKELPKIDEIELTLKINSVNFNNSGEAVKEAYRISIINSKLIVKLKNKNATNITYEEMNGLFLKNGFYDSEFCEIKKIGEGTYGEVYEVLKLRTKERFAIQRIEMKNHEQTNCYIHGLAKLNFPVINGLKQDNIVQYFDKWLEKNNHKNVNYAYIQMELSDFTLNDLMREFSKFPLLVKNDCLTLLGYYISCQIFTQILKGVNYLHKQNPQIIHRNINPDDILLKISEDKENIVKISDFGLTCLHKPKDQRHSQDIGHIRYAAHEVLESTKYDTRADIYSLGIILGELFLIDINSDYEESKEASLLINEYQELKSLYTKMIKEDANSRQNCHQILAEKELWTLNDNHFERLKTDFEKFSQNCDDKTSLIAKLINKFFRSLNEEQLYKHLNIKEIIIELRKNKSFEKYSNKFDEIENLPNFEIHEYIHKNILNKHNELELSEFVRTLLSLEKLINVDKIIKTLFENNEESEKNKVRTYTKEKKVNLLMERIDNDYKALLNLLLLTGQDNAALILDLNAIGLIDLSHCDFNKGHLDYYSLDEVKPKVEFYYKKGTISRSNKYLMNNSPKGYCYLLNNCFTIGTYKEMQRFGNIFHNLEFKVIMRKNISENEIYSDLIRISRNDNLNKHNAFVFMAISNGNEKEMYGFDGKALKIDSLINIFNEDNCPQLSRKPKMFFINCIVKSSKKSFSQHELTPLKAVAGAALGALQGAALGWMAGVALGAVAGAVVGWASELGVYLGAVAGAALGAVAGVTSGAVAGAASGAKVTLGAIAGVALGAVAGAALGAVAGWASELGVYLGAVAGAALGVVAGVTLGAVAGVTLGAVAGMTSGARVTLGAVAGVALGAVARAEWGVGTELGAVAGAAFGAALGAWGIQNYAKLYFTASKKGVSQHELTPLKAVAGAALGALAGAALGAVVRLASELGVDLGAVAGTTLGAVAGVTSGAVAGTTLGAVAGVTSGAIAGAASGAVAGASGARVTLGAVAGVTLGAVVRATLGAVAEVTSGAVAGAASGAVAGAASGARVTLGAVVEVALGAVAGAASGAVAGAASGARVTLGVAAEVALGAVTEVALGAVAGAAAGVAAGAAAGAVSEAWGRLTRYLASLKDLSTLKTEALDSIICYSTLKEPDIYSKGTLFGKALADSFLQRVNYEDLNEIITGANEEIKKLIGEKTDVFIQFDGQPIKVIEKNLNRKIYFR